MLLLQPPSHASSNGARDDLRPPAGLRVADRSVSRGRGGCGRRPAGEVQPRSAREAGPADPSEAAGGSSHERLAPSFSSFNGLANVECRWVGALGL